jgi:hypothetical protein
MKNMRRFLTLAAAFLLAATNVRAADYGVYKFSSPVSGAISAVSTDVGLYVKYIGSTAGKPTVEVDAATGDITFKIAGSADTTVGCPTIGTGIVDVSDAACDTFSEVINKVIGQSSNWLLAPGAVLGSDTTINTLGTQAATDTNIRTSGVALLLDTAVSFDVAAQLIPPGYTQATFGSFWFQGNRVNPDAFGGVLFALHQFRAASTYGSGTSTLAVYAVKSTFAGAPGSGSYKEVVRTVWTETGGATTVENQTDFGNSPLLALGERFIFRIENSAALTAPALVVSGAAYRK